MKKILTILLILMCSVAFIHADSPIDGAFVGADMIGEMEGDFPISSALLQVSLKDTPFDVYTGIGINDKFVKTGLVFTPWEFVRFPLGMYAGGGVAFHEETSGDLVESYSGFSLTGIGEVGAIILFTPAAHLRLGYSYFDQRHTMNVGLVLGWAEKGIGVYKGDKK